ncbi:MAG: response regulator [Spirochaetales bacterium]|jgi:CheY-like chemotaxis protein|nr:response regulator [Spirochaetales bacterium]
MTKGKLLLVDDVPANIKVLVEALEDEYEIIIATGGGRALGWASSDDPPDLILLDIMMPGMDGYEVCQRLKNKPETAHIPVIFVTAMHEEEDETKGLSLGAVDYVHKPYSLSIIKARIETQLALKHQQDELARAKEELKQANEFLESRVEERTAALVATNLTLVEEVFAHKKTAEALDLAKAAADQASRAKRDFLDNMSHEIRTPINGIVGFSSLLQTSPLTEQQQTYLEMISTSTNRLLTTVDKVLDFAKIENESLKLQGRVFSVHELLDAVVYKQSDYARKKNIMLHCVKGDDLPEHVVGDPVRLEQIINNMVDNGIKFSDQGTVQIHALLDRQMDNSVVIHFKVVDKGLRMAPEAQRQVFAAFNQEDMSNTRRYEGTGLGLTISSLLVEMMGGRIWVDSVVGYGATFHFSVALDLATDGVESYDTWQATDSLFYSYETTESEQVEAASRGSAHILLAEDEMVNRCLLQDLLEEQGWDVTAVCDGKEALAAYESSVTFERILMDIQMPEMTGHEVTQAIRVHEAKNGQHIPIIAVTAHALAGDREKCLSVGMDDYVSKPVHAEYLFKMVREYLVS